MSDIALIFSTALEWPFAALDGNGDPLDLTGKTVSLVAKRGATTRITRVSTDSAQITVDAGAGGTGTVHFVSASTSGFTSADETLSYYIQADDGAGNLSPIDSGIITTSAIPPTYAYLTYQDFDGLIPNGTLVQLCGERGDSQPITAVTDPRVNAVIYTVARNMWLQMTGYLATRYIIPATVPAGLPTVILIDCTRFGLYLRRPTTPAADGGANTDPFRVAQERYRYWMGTSTTVGFLEQVREGIGEIPELSPVTWVLPAVTAEEPAWEPPYASS